MVPCALMALHVSVASVLTHVRQHVMANRAVLMDAVAIVVSAIGVKTALNKVNVNACLIAMVVNAVMTAAVHSVVFVFVVKPATTMDSAKPTTEAVQGTLN